MLAFALTALFLLLLLQAWLGWRLAGPFPAAVARWIWGMQVAFTVALPLGMVLSRAGSGRLAVTVAAVAFVAMGLWSILVAGMLSWEVLRWLSAALDLAARGLGLPGPGALLPADPVLRAVWARAGVLAVLGAALFLTLGAVISDRAAPRVVPITITRPGLPADLEGLRIALISDLHVGPTARRAFVAGVVEQVNALQPDLIACTGDLADGSVSALAAEVAPLAALQAPLGVWFVTGNHEYFSGAEGWLAEVERLGMVPLINEHRALTRGEARLLVAGVPDHTAGRMLPGHSPDARAALAGAPAADFTLMLAHQPRDAQACADAGADLVLAGHTHGGQFFPWTALIRLIEPWIAGRYRLGGTDLYVTPGTGTGGPPMRLGTRKEITLITLRSG
ncbi:MAG: metallophosphoesterase [Pseudomonadota bacterium]